MGTQGYSGKAAATALAPASFVNFDRPTKNSRPVNNTSPPSRRAFLSAISTKGSSSSFFKTTLIASI